MRAKRGTPESDRLDVLVTLVKAWERQHYPLGFPDPIEGALAKAAARENLGPPVGEEGRISPICGPKT